MVDVRDGLEVENEIKYVMMVISWVIFSNVG